MLDRRRFTGRMALFAAAVAALSATASAVEARDVLRSWIAADIRGTNPGQLDRAMTRLVALFGTAG